MEEKPRTYSGYDGDVPHAIGGYSGGSGITRTEKRVPKKKAATKSGIKPGSKGRRRK